MSLIEQLEARVEALKVAELARLFGVTPQHLYKMAASGRIPSFRIAGAVRFDPQEIAEWLKRKKPVGVAAVIPGHRRAAG